jgi:hypothetical protein
MKDMGGSRTSQFSLRNLRTIPAPDSVYGGRTIQSQAQQRSGRPTGAGGLWYLGLGRLRECGGVGPTQYQRVRILDSIDGISRCVLSDGGLRLTMRTA